MTGCVRVLPDYASRTTRGRIPLEKVGIKNVRMHRLDFTGLRVLTTQAAYVNLIESNGIHMSRLVEALTDFEDEPIGLDESILYKLATSHETDNSYWECEWVSEFHLEDEQPVFIDCALDGIKVKDLYQWYLTTCVPYASVCPCSAEMVKEHGGIPHMQRATAKVTGQLNPSAEDDLGEFLTTAIARIVDTVKLVPIPLMKRGDELDWCQRASHTNLFVEDAARIVGEAIDDWFDDWVVVCEHNESIHQHDVVAVRRKGVKLV